MWHSELHHFVQCKQRRWKIIQRATMAHHLAWKRPLGVVSYPNIWFEFSAKPKNSDKTFNYRVQDLPEDRFEDAMAFMKRVFIAGEPLAQSVGEIILNWKIYKIQFDVTQTVFVIAVRFWTMQMAWRIVHSLRITIYCGVYRWPNACQWLFSKKILMKSWPSTWITWPRKMTPFTRSSHQKYVGLRHIFP